MSVEKGRYRCLECGESMGRFDRNMAHFEQTYRHVARDVHGGAGPAGPGLYHEGSQLAEARWGGWTLSAYCGPVRPIADCAVEESGVASGW